MGRFEITDRVVVGLYTNLVTVMNMFPIALQIFLR